MAASFLNEDSDTDSSDDENQQELKYNTNQSTIVMVCSFSLNTKMRQYSTHKFSLFWTGFTKEGKITMSTR